MVKVKKDQNAEEKILAAAREVFMEKGLDGGRMQDIADKAGINKALLHYYFRSKDKLFEVIFREAATAFSTRIHAVMSSEISLFEKIESFVNEYTGMLMQNPYLPLFILNEINRQPQAFIQRIWGSKRPPVDKLIEAIEKEVKGGKIKPINGIQLMMNMVSMCIFPFVARPMIQWITKTTDAQFRQLMEQRKTEVAKFIIDSIRK
jgi:TetR/AcrR family transcriptional regulator